MRRLGEVLEQQRASADGLKAISQSTGDLQSVLVTLAATAAQLCKVEAAAIIRPGDGRQNQVAHIGFAPEYYEYLKSIPLSPGPDTLIGRVLLEGKAVQNSDTSSGDVLLSHREPFQTWLGVPLLRERVPIGAMVLARSMAWPSRAKRFGEGKTPGLGRARPLPFDAREIDLVKTFADQASIAIENARLFEELHARTGELGEALEQQKATAEILRVIGTSPTDAQPVFDTIVRNAVSLCGGQFANVFRFDGELLHFVTNYNVGPNHPTYLDLLQTKYPMRPDWSQVSGRVLLTKSVVHLEDALADPDYDQRFPKAMGWRRVLGVPMLRKGEPVGVVIVGWVDAGSVPEAQEALLKTFADQAVIAIENVRLLDELRARTNDLSEALQVQTTTADVLKVIGRSAFDLQAVLHTLVEAAARLCEADAAAIARQRGAAYYHVAHYGVPAGYTSLVKDLPLLPGRGSVVGRVLMEHKSVQITDVLADPEYTVFEFQEVAGIRTLLGVPLLRERNPIGVFVLWRCAVRPFSDKQIELLTTFADQAVIAIENARLFDEVRNKTYELEVANKYKSHFLASASHDLRQPLHALNLFVAQLQAEGDPAERRQLVVRIEAAVGSMNELFEAMLDMTKLEAGILKPNLAVFSVGRLLKRVETTFADAALTKGLRLRVVQNNAWVASDFILLERILLNLVSNAVRYTERGGVVVGCRRKGQNLRIDVCDSGAGIPDEQRQSIFAEYYQLAGPGPNSSGGLGLGLAIVDRLCRLLGHKVELESRSGRGSRFSVAVSLAARPQTAAELQDASSAIADPARGKRVIVIDDDALVLEGMRGILESWGCEVKTAASGKAALAALAGKGEAPELIISDSRLGDGETGIEAIERLRRAAGAPIPAFVITGDTAPERLREASAAGLHLLHKPVSPMVLRTALNRVLRSPPAARAAGDA